MSSEDLCKPDQSIAFEGEISDDSLKNSTNVSNEELEEIIKRGKALTEYIKEIDPIIARKSKVVRNIDESLKYYKDEELKRSKKNVKQTNKTNFLRLDKMLVSLVKSGSGEVSPMNLRRESIEKIKKKIQK